MVGKLKLKDRSVLLECYRENKLVKSFEFDTASDAIYFANNDTRKIDTIEIYKLPSFDFSDGVLEECLHIEFLPLLDEDYLFEMARIPKRYTGLPYDIWLDPMGADRSNTHNVPRLKIRVDSDTLVPVTISDNPEIPNSVLKNRNIKLKEFSKVKQFIIRNKLFLLMHYYRQLDDVQISDIIKNLSKIPSPEDLDPSQVIEIANKL